MTQDDIISMAHEAGMNANVGHEVNGAHLPAIAAIRSSVPVEWLQRFAALVATKAAAAEREACARICDRSDMSAWGFAHAIRARGGNEAAAAGVRAWITKEKS